MASSTALLMFTYVTVFLQGAVVQAQARRSAVAKGRARGSARFFEDPNRMVRQCSCQEQRMCVADMKRQGQQCVDQCWYHMNSLTSRPQQLKQCFNAKQDMIEGFINCFEANMDGCVAGRNGPMIPKQNLDKILSRGQSKARSTLRRKNSITALLMGPLKRVLDTAMTFGDCVKTCFRQRGGDLCYDRYNCQPKLPTEERAKRMVRQCSSGIDLRREGGDLCNCAVRAGVSDLASYCPILEAMASRAVPRRG